ncbi:hypothetical protein OIU77_026351 [Salix suchowensis]|uniref:Uncharacterized protein n=1 Tax=Salix suchowensis TaxID=1278906 RepID=A0ABQ9BMX6_9ROSI|nr:hypothetical protein OIU77_026351 [Salix suchowensis]
MLLPAKRPAQQLASCSVGFAGKMTNNVGRDAVIAQGPSTVMGPDGKQLELGQMDGDAIRLASASKDWSNGSRKITATEPSRRSITLFVESEQKYSLHFTKNIVVPICIFVQEDMIIQKD